MKNRILIRTIKNIYKNSGSRLIDSKSLDELTPDDIHKLNCFHATDVDMVTLDDEYFCGIRANHFCIEFGWSEEDSDNTPHILISANHKGIRVITLLDD